MNTGTANDTPLLNFSFQPLKINQILVITYFFLLAVTVNVFVFESKNLAFIGFGIVGIAALIILNGKLLLNIHWTYFALAFLLVLSFLVNVTDAEVLSFFYSLYFIVAYWIFTSYFKREINVKLFKKTLFILLVSYLFVLVMGQLYVYAGFFTNTNISTGLVHNPLGTLFEAGRGFRYYSLATEPSTAAFIVITILYVYLEADIIDTGKKRTNLKVWLIALYMLFWFQSGYGVILLFVLILSRVSLRNAVILILGGLLLLAVAFYMKLPTVERVMFLLFNFNLYDLENIRNIDHSASFRILPMYYYLTNIELTNYQFYIGHGAGQSVVFLIPFLFAVPVESFEGGFFPQFLYDYGIIFGIIFVIFLFREVITRIISFETFVVVLMMTNANFNTQLFWFVITCFALLKWYRTRASWR